MVKTKWQIGYIRKTIRIPESLFNEIKQFAKLDKRSENSEIILALEQYFLVRKGITNYKNTLEKEETEGQ